MSKPKPINFRPEKLEDLILERLHADEEKKDWNKSELVRYCIRVAGESLLDEEEFKEILIHSARF